MQDFTQALTTAAALIAGFDAELRHTDSRVAEVAYWHLADFQCGFFH